LFGLRETIETECAPARRPVKETRDLVEGCVVPAVPMEFDHFWLSVFITIEVDNATRGPRIAQAVAAIVYPNSQRSRFLVVMVFD
jgi:hypothetical protein